MIFQLTLLPSEVFLPKDSEETPDISSRTDPYVGNLIVRSIDSLLNNSIYEEIFNNSDICTIIKTSINDSPFHVRQLISKHVRRYLENGGVNKDIDDIAWKLLFDKEYAIFSDSAHAICSIVGNTGNHTSFLDDHKVHTLITHSKTDDVTDRLRIFEFCGMLGLRNDGCFLKLRECGIYDEIFKVYLQEDVLVKLNCLEILGSMLPLLNRLNFQIGPSSDFIKHSMDLFVAEDHLLLPSVLRFFSTILSVPNVLADEDVRSFGKHVSELLNSSNVTDPRYLSSLSIFGFLYIKGLTDKQTCANFVETFKNSTNEDVMYSCMESLETIAHLKRLDLDFEFIGDVTSCVMDNIHRFPFGEIRELFYTFLLHTIDYNCVVEKIIAEEQKSKVFTKPESNHQVTITKRKMIKEFLSRLAELYPDGALPLDELTIKTLKSL
ncbi:hypothetical protein BEWA_052360 [Theileria equi strain WA]|uniref:SPIN90/Ldb17 leucine-rich domain-containing protein n=1 Tax=Theileria equi strain WA TaxID=1537102 RepID=L1LCW1_THEEQ|nr:hypothetical protein BEWA_052360 [Theileria equi strain WA]EKX73181.1 hypothetical protein BEWA_052360 [Theileria equi strain WA]|eukprot:XP_004832633.1 hypothetical protein BEWA_052360 [Theileria equi strain WA]